MFQARIAQAKQELLGQGRDAICPARLLGTSAYLVCGSASWVRFRDSIFMPTRVRAVE